MALIKLIVRAGKLGLRANGMNKESKLSAFTIVELLIVVVVIAILAAVTIVSYNGISSKAKASAAQSLLSQTVSKVKLYAVDHSDTYPTSLSDVGITNTSLQYTGSSSSYCITATSQSVSYYQSNTVTTPQAGACPGHGVNGVAAITNYYKDPKPSSVSNGANAWGGTAGTGNVYTVSNVSSEWSASGKANRIIWTSAGNPGSGGVVINISSSGYQADQKFTLAYKLRLISGSCGIGTISMDRYDSSLGVSTTYDKTDTISSMTVGQTYVVYVTFSADEAAIPTTNNYRMYTTLINKVDGVTVEYADIDLYPGDYDASRTWHSGDSTNWVWNGTANNSTSTGPN